MGEKILEGLILEEEMEILGNIGRDAPEELGIDTEETIDSYRLRNPEADILVIPTSDGEGRWLKAVLQPGSHTIEELQELSKIEADIAHEKIKREKGVIEMSARMGKSRQYLSFLIKKSPLNFILYYELGEGDLSVGIERWRKVAQKQFMRLDEILGEVERLGGMGDFTRYLSERTGERTQRITYLLERLSLAGYGLEEEGESPKIKTVRKAVEFIGLFEEWKRR